GGHRAIGRPAARAARCALPAERTPPPDSARNAHGQSARGGVTSAVRFADSGDLEIANFGRQQRRQEGAPLRLRLLRWAEEDAGPPAPEPAPLQLAVIHCRVSVNMDLGDRSRRTGPVPYLLVSVLRVRTPLLPIYDPAAAGVSDRLRLC